MAEEATTILQLVLVLTWTCLSTCSEKRKHPTFSKVLLSQDVVEGLLTSVAVVFAPGLFKVLQSTTPPTISYFKSLPINDE
jgi:hypothetical protein